MEVLVSRARSRPLVLAGLVVLTLLLLWLEVIPPNGSPDEKSHFVRLGGIASGHPFGTPPAAAPADFDALTPAQIERVRREAGIFHVDANYLYLSGGDCNSFYSDVPACAAPLPHPDAQTSISEHAHSQIVGYLLPAVLSSVGWSGRSTFYLARLGTVLTATMLVICGLVSVRRAAPNVDIVFTAAGAAVGITPLVAFLGGAIAPAIIGTFGSIALCMCTWAIVKMSVVRVIDRGIWIIALVAACASASVGVPYAVLAILAALVAAWVGPRRLILRLGITGSISAAAIAVGAGLWDLIWRVNLPATEPVGSRSTWSHNFSVVFNTSRDVADQLGWLDVSMPMAVKLITGALFLWWVLRTLVFDSWRFFLLIGAVACGFLAIAMWLTHSIEPTGFSSQARYFLPAICVFPIVAALRLLRLPSDMRDALRPGLTLVLWGVGMTCALYALLRRHVVGAKGPIWFFGHGAFRPFGGWLLPAVTLAAYWVVLALLVSTPREHHDPAPA